MLFEFPKICNIIMEPQNHGNNSFALIINNFGRKEPKQLFNTGQYFVQDFSKHNYHKSEYKNNFVSSHGFTSNSFNGKKNKIGNYSKSHEYIKRQNNYEERFFQNDCMRGSRKQKKRRNKKWRSNVSKDSIRNGSSVSLGTSPINSKIVKTYEKKTDFKSNGDNRKLSNNAYQQETKHFTNSAKHFNDTSDTFNNFVLDINEKQDTDLFFFDISGNKKELSNKNTENNFVEKVQKYELWNDIKGSKKLDNIEALQHHRKSVGKKEIFGNHGKPHEIYSDLLHKINRSKLKNDQSITDVINTKSETNKVSNFNFCKKIKNKGFEELVKIKKDKSHHLKEKKRKRHKDEDLNDLTCNNDERNNNVEVLQSVEKELNRPKKKVKKNENELETVDLNSSNEKAKSKNKKPKNTESSITTNNVEDSRANNICSETNDDGCKYLEVKKKKTKQSKNEYNKELTKKMEYTTEDQSVDAPKKLENLIENRKKKKKKNIENVENIEKSHIVEDEQEISFVGETPKKKKKKKSELDLPERIHKSNSLQISEPNNDKDLSKEDVTTKSKRKACGLGLNESSILEGIMTESLKMQYLQKPSSVTESESSIIDLTEPTRKKKKKSATHVDSTIDHTVTKKHKKKNKQRHLQEDETQGHEGIVTSQKKSKKGDRGEPGPADSTKDQEVLTMKEKKKKISAMECGPLDAETKAPGEVDALKKRKDSDGDALRKKRDVLDNHNAKRKKKKGSKQVFEPRDNSIYTIFEDDESSNHSELVNPDVKPRKKHEKVDKANVDPSNETNFKEKASSLSVTKKKKKTVRSSGERHEDAVTSEEFTAVAGKAEKSDAVPSPGDQKVALAEALEDEIEKLKELRISLPFTVPPLHALATRTTDPTKEQQDEIQRSNLTVKLGPFSKKEDEKILENWKKLCKEYNLSANPSLFVKFPNKMRMETKLDILRYIAHGLDDRMVHRVYIRFRHLLRKESLKLGRFTAQEDKQILEFMEGTTSRCPFKDLSELLGRTAIAVEKRYDTLQNGREKVNYNNPEMADRFVKALLAVAKCDKIRKLKRREFTGKEWRRVSRRLDNIPVKSLERAWKVTIYPRLFSKETNLKEVKEDIVHILIDRKETDWRTVHWKEIARYFKGFTAEKLYMMFKHLVYFKVPKQLHSDLNACLEFLDDKIIKYNNMSSPHKFKKYVVGKNGSLCYESDG